MRLFLIAIACGVATSLLAETDDAVARRLQEYLDSLGAENRLSGAILIAKDGKPIASKAAGLANRETGEANTLETKFNIGSMNKMFTAVAIAQLEQSGKLKFDDTVAKLLPDYPNKEVAQKVTVHQLLTHTSGMGSYYANREEFMSRRSELTSVAAHLPLFVNEPLAFAPGEKFQYSNSGYMLLGAIIEKLSGQDYYEYVREHIFAPAGMNSTGFYVPGTDNPGVAIGYTRMDRNGQRGESETPNTERREIRGGPAGGGYSTVGDLVKFSVALREHKLLDGAHTTLVTSGKVEAGPMGKYAYGFGDSVTAGKHIIFHNGGAPGTAAQLDMFPELGYSAAILMNTDPPALMPVMMKVRELIPGS